MSAALAVGYHGKVPARGDFVGHGLPRGILDPWDGWLSQGLAEAARQLGGRWERAAAEAPVWRFALSAGLCGDAPLVGVLMPSLDRVGRFYPFTVAAALRSPSAGPVALAALPVTCAGWLARAESVAAAACREGADLDALPARMAILGRPEVERRALPASVVERLVGPVPDGASLWWTRGDGRCAPTILSCAGMPSAARFVALLDGAWASRGWDDLDAIPPD